MIIGQANFTEMLAFNNAVSFSYQQVFEALEPRREFFRVSSIFVRLLHILYLDRL